MSRAAAWGAAASVLGATLAGCAGNHDVLNPAGVRARHVAELWWFLLSVSAVVFAVVLGAALWATFRRRGAEDEPTKRRVMTRWVAGSVAATVVILFVFLGVDLVLGRGAGGPPAGGPPALVIDLTGHQWWWEVEYENALPAKRLTTANEIHVPVGQTVVLKLSSTDVIHSFWVPNLAGKTDLIPGHPATTWFRADRPGVYRGQCAEFCGLQHAKMALLVIAEPVDSFALWYARQLRPAAPPRDSISAHGQTVFLSKACVMCHTVRGTPAGGRVAPDLTHIASRRTLGAATVPNTRGNLAGWVLDSQRMKPGNHMPPNPMTPHELQALLAYLEGLR